MASPDHKYVLDTQLFIQGFREAGANEALQRFHRSFAPFEYLSAIVAQELRSGTRSPRDLKALERHVLTVFGRVNRVIVPSIRAWHRSGDVLAEMARKDGLAVARVSKAFANDVLLALSCREAGCVLVTDNERDFARIRRFAQFEFVGSWPKPATQNLLGPCQMLALRRPSDADIAAFLDRQSRVSLSYAGVGATRSDPPSGYNVDHNRVRLGEGEAAFNRAVASVRRWEMFNIGQVMLCWPGAPIEIGQDVGILIALYGLWSLNACRIVYTLDADDDADDEVRRFGFAYGTLADHMESGEERFSVEWHRGDDSVWYDLLAFSRPRHPLARLGMPLSRSLQRRFARDSLQAMVRAFRSGPDGS